VDAYHNRSTDLDEADLALRGDLTDYEKHLVESQDLVQIRIFSFLCDFHIYRWVWQKFTPLAIC
jgi:ABC-type uncharacterized transport system auxiliary subunit